MADSRHIAAGVRAGVRSDGRSCKERRITRGDGAGTATPFDVTLDVLCECYGSARATGARGENDVMVGVKLDLIKPQVDGGGGSHGEVVVKVTGPGLSRTTIDPARLEDFFRSLLVGGNNKGGGFGLDTSAMCILGAKLAWRVLVDVIVINCDGCGIVDCAGVAMKCALASTRLPKLSISRDAASAGPSGQATESVMAKAFGGPQATGEAAAGASFEFEIENDDDDGGDRGGGGGEPIDVSKVPVAICVAKIAGSLSDDRGAEEEEEMGEEDDYGVGKYFYLSGLKQSMKRSDYVIDPTLDEERCSDMLLLVGVQRGRAGGEGVVCCVRSIRGGSVADGGGLILGSALQDMMSMAARSGGVLADAVDVFLENKR